ncbi:MAG: glycosyltransferase WbuB, partial [Chloroflexota bacterium]
LLRTGRLARALAARGHQVTWWSSTFDHTTKTYVPVRRRVVEVDRNLTLRLLHGMAYRRNLSVARLINHWQLGREFRARATALPRPDLILCSFPTIELAVEATRLGRRTHTPVVLDVRDLWPDLFLSVLPSAARAVARLVLGRYFHMARRALGAADAVIGISDGYLEWGLRYARRARRPTDAVIVLGYEPLDDGDADPLRDRELLASLGVDPSLKICWFIGTFSRHFDLQPVIEAARTLWQAGYRDVQFVLSGAGDLDASWRRLAAGVPNVVFTGWINRPQIRAMLRSAYLGLAAYAVNAPMGLPNKIFEYMCAGVPIISSLRGETETLLGRLGCGYTYPATDTAGLVRLLRRVIDDPAERDRMAAAARGAFREHFTAGKVDAQLAAHLEMVARDLALRPEARACRGLTNSSRE